MKSTWVFVILITALSGCQWIPGFSSPATLTPQPSSAPVTATVAATSTPPSLTTVVPPTTIPSPPAPTPVVATRVAPTGPLVLAAQDLIVNNAKPPYEIKLHYPEITGAILPGLQTFNAESKKLAQELLAGFQSDFDKAGPLPEPSAAPGSFMETNYSVTHGEHGLLSVLFVAGFYFSGAAHPNSYAISLNFDLIHGKKLELADLFLPGSNYLTALSDACTADLKKRDLLVFPEGALPKFENYKNWNITPQGLQFTFDPYQVAPYAMGSSRVLLPFGSLKTLLNPNGPLAVLIK